MKERRKRTMRKERNREMLEGSCGNKGANLPRCPAFPQSRPPILARVLFWPLLKKNDDLIAFTEVRANT